MGFIRKTLRMYEREGLLKPSRSEGNTRLYTAEDLERLELVLSLTRDLGVNLAGVEVILNMRRRMEEMQAEMSEFIKYVEQQIANRSPRNGSEDSARPSARPSSARCSSERWCRFMKRSNYTRVVPTDSLGVYLKEISAFPQLSPTEEKEIIRKARQGDEESFQMLIESNLRFVVSMAKKYSRSGYPMHELINEGNLGLIEAARRFDPDRDVRFITYASWWVRQAILAAIAHYGQVFSIPPKFKHQLYRFQTKVGRLTQELGHRPSVEEISEKLRMTEGEVRGMMETVPSEVSLSAPLGEDGEFQVQDRIEDSSIAPLDQALITESFERELQELLDQLDEKERFIIERRYGLRDDEPQTLGELGEKLNLSRERIRQIQAKALDKLRRSQRARQLTGYLN